MHPTRMQALHATFVVTGGVGAPTIPAQSWQYAERDSVQTTKRGHISKSGYFLF